MKKMMCVMTLFLTFCGAYAAKYYINLSSNHDYTLRGKTADSAFGGCIGLQRFVDTCAAGDTALIKGYGDMRKIQWLSFATVSDTWVRGDTIDNATRAGTGIVYQDSASLRLLAEVQTGSFVNGDSIYNRPKTADGKLNAVPTYPGIVIYKTSAAVNTPITIIGVNASWVNDGTRDTIDGYSVSGISHIKIGKSSSALHYYNWQNITFYRATGYNVYAPVLNSSSYWYFNNCAFLGIVGECIRGLDYLNLYQCTIQNATSGIIYCRYLSVSHCLVSNCTYGIWLSGGAIDQSVLSGKGGAVGIGLSPFNSGAGSNLFVTNSVIDSFGIGFYADYMLNNKVSKCKFTNNVTASIKVATGYRVFEDDNIFLNNGNSNQIMLVGTGQCLSRGNGSVYSGTIGYTDKANGDFSPTINATGRRVKTNIGVK